MPKPNRQSSKVKPPAKDDWRLVFDESLPSPYDNADIMNGDYRVGQLVLIRGQGSKSFVDKLRLAGFIIEATE